METTAIKYWESLPEQPYKASPRYYSDGDFLTYFIDDRRCVAHRVNALLTVYTMGDELVGCKVKGVQLLVEKLRSFHIEVTDGKIKLGLLFLSLRGEASDEEKPEIDRIAKKFADADAAIPSEAVAA